MEYDPKLDPDAQFDPEADDGYNEPMPVEQPKGKKFGVQVFKSAPKSLDQSLWELQEFGDPEKTGQVRGKSKRVKAVDHNARTRDLIASFGYDPCKEETWRMGRGGFSFKVDKYGLWDWSGTKAGKPLMYTQAVTGEDGLKRHLREMTSDKLAADNRKPKLFNLRACLARGENCSITVWTKQPNGRWTGADPLSPRVVRITAELVDSVVARKRKPR